MRDNNSKKPFFNREKENSGSSVPFKKDNYKGKSGGTGKPKSFGSSKFGPKRKGSGKEEDDFADFKKKARTQKGGFKSLGEKKFGSKTAFGNKQGKDDKFAKAGDQSRGKKNFFNKGEDSEIQHPLRKDFSPKTTVGSGNKKTSLVYKGRGKDQKPMFAEGKPTYKTEKRPSKPFGKSRFVDQDEQTPRPDYNFDGLPQKKNRQPEDERLIRLNKYIANSGICSRREADVLIAGGLVTLNGEVCTELGRKVKRTDRVVYQGKKINPEKPVYVLLNKPKDFITTTDDPMDRKTVMNLVGNACEERIFPVGRLDRNTTGLLLFTNDGELAAKLSHPSNEIKKIYQVTLDKSLTKNDEEAINEGLELEDGKVEVDDMQVLSLDRKILGLEIHVGRNRIVRRIFAHLGYDVTALDRVVYAGLDKKDLKRGHYRFLTEHEVVRLKYFI